MIRVYKLPNGALTIQEYFSERAYGPTDTITMCGEEMRTHDFIRRLERGEWDHLEKFSIRDETNPDVRN